MSEQSEAKDCRVCSHGTVKQYSAAQRRVVHTHVSGKRTRDGMNTWRFNLALYRTLWLLRTKSKRLRNLQIIYPLANCCGKRAEVNRPLEGSADMQAEVHLNDVACAFQDTLSPRHSTTAVLRHCHLVV